MGNFDTRLRRLEERLAPSGGNWLCVILEDRCVATGEPAPCKDCRRTAGGRHVLLDGNGVGRPLLPGIEP